MTNEFSKADKKAARIAINIALQRDFKQILNGFYDLLQKWKTEDPEDSADVYRQLYQSVRNKDKYIASTYDAIGASDLLLRIVGMVNNNILTEEDLTGFSEEARLRILAVVEMFRKNRLDEQ